MLLLFIQAFAIQLWATCDSFWATAAPPSFPRCGARQQVLFAATTHELNDEAIAEKFEEIIFEAALPMILTEDERISILYPFLPRLDARWFACLIALAS